MRDSTPVRLNFRVSRGLRCFLLTCCLLNAVLYSLLMPLWEGFDEPFHFGYIQTIANGDGLPDVGITRLSAEIRASIQIAPTSLSVQRSLHEGIIYSDYFAWPESQRRQTHESLSQIAPSLRREPSHFLNYEAQQAPLAYLLLAAPEKLLSHVPLPERVVALRIICGIVGSLLLLVGTERVCAQLEMSRFATAAALFCILSTQMTWATLSRVSNDWLAIPLAVWFLAAALSYRKARSLAALIFLSIVLALGLLTKAYFLALVPLALLLCWRRPRKDLAVIFLVLAGLAGPWYGRNLIRYHSLTGMQESHVNPADALSAVSVADIPSAIDSWARSALWTANNSYRSYSTNTLRILLGFWGFGLLLWCVKRPRAPEWIVLAHCALFALALLYYVALSYAFLHDPAVRPEPWYSQVLIAPLLVIAFLGAERSGKIGRLVATALVTLFGYILLCTYWVKLIPLYSGFDQRNSFIAVTRLYLTDSSRILAGLSAASSGPASVILALSGFVTVLALVLIFILLRGAWRPIRTH
jgi:hypothetical protein